MQQNTIVMYNPCYNIDDFTRLFIIILCYGQLTSKIVPIIFTKYKSMMQSLLIQTTSFLLLICTALGDIKAGYVIIVRKQMNFITKEMAIAILYA